MNFSIEQQNIFSSNCDIRINAVAGSGKTTTLIEYAKTRNANAKILYIVFNRSVKIEAEAKFRNAGVNNVEIQTGHSLAYNRIMSNSNYKLKMGEGYKAQNLVDILKIGHFKNSNIRYIIANHVYKLISLFCNSNKLYPEDINYPSFLLDLESINFVKIHWNTILKNAYLFLEKMYSAEIEITHDFYLKQFQLSKPILHYDYILFDEGQDASEVMLDVFIRQKAIRVIVGDTHQQIYSWRFAFNSLEKVTFSNYHLSKSYRFEDNIANLAKKIIDWKSSFIDMPKFTIYGVGKRSKIISRAVLARSNVSLLVKAIEMLIEKKEIQSVYFEGRIESYVYADDGASLYDVLNLYLNKRSLIRDKLIRSMADIKALEDYVRNTEDAQLNLMLDVVKKYGQNLPVFINKIKEAHLKTNIKEDADMIFSTVHKSKGMEYDEVTLTNDFITETKITRLALDKNLTENMKSKIIEEINLLYVAVTRAKSIVNLPEGLFLADELMMEQPNSSK